MKLNWGKEVCCPKCAALFYTMTRASLVCPGCGYKFEISELTSKKNAKLAGDEVQEYDEKAVMTGFEPLDEDAVVEIADNEALADEQAVVEDMKLVDGGV